jgi:glycosyltransferase involved in cell wall biosynthesis
MRDMTTSGIIGRTIMSTAVGVRAMIDFHSHFLPAMDDGAVDVAEATAMLTASVAQGVHTVVATPHFYRSENTIASFLQLRQKSFNLLDGHIPDGLSVVLGAEVRLQRGLSRLDLRDLCIQGTNRILIDCYLNLIGTIQDQGLYEELLVFIKDNGLTERVRFFFELTQEQVAQIVQESDINLSVSNWETFGRGIFEGISCGLPTFVFSKLTGVRKICNENKGVCFVNTSEEMAIEIERVIKSPEIYFQMSNSLKELANAVSSEKEKKRLVDVLLNRQL